MKCPNCGKTLLPGSLLGFAPGFQWVHICDLPTPANEESYEAPSRS